MTTGRASAWLVLFALAGCSSIPAGDDPALDPDVVAISRANGPKLGRIGVAPIVELGFAPDETVKGWKASDSPAIDLERARLDVVKALDATGRFDRVRLTGHDALAEAWRERDDYVATIEIENLRSTFEGHHTGLWVLNIANWLFWIVPSWFVATEEYSLTFDATLTLRSAESGAVIERRPILRERHPIRVDGDFDELDRGWQFFGFIAPSFDKEVWTRIASQLWPKAQSELAAGAARTVDDVLGATAGATRVDQVRKKTLALVVGLSRYEDPVQLPPLPFAANDARAVRVALASRGVPGDHLTTLVDSQATLPAVRKAFAEELGRAREGDTTLVYFSGYGSRAPDGAPALLLSEAGAAGGEGRLSFAELASLLATVKGKKLLVVDAGLGGRARSVGVPTAATQDDLALFARDPGLAAILAGEATDPVLEPEHLSLGLLTFHFVSGLKGAADEDRDGRITVQEIFNYVRPRVVAEAALLGEKESPRAMGLDRTWALEVQGQKP